MTKAKTELADALAEAERRRDLRARRSSQRPLEIAKRIARQHPWCDPKRVAECYGCACRKDARQQLRTGRAESRKTKSR